MRSSFTPKTNLVLTEEFTTRCTPTGEAIQKAVALWLAKEIHRVMG